MDVDELPGMWESADLSGGLADAQDATRIPAGGVLDEDERHEGDTCEAVEAERERLCADLEQLRRGQQRARAFVVQARRLGSVKSEAADVLLGLLGEE